MSLSKINDQVDSSPSEESPNLLDDAASNDEVSIHEAIDEIEDVIFDDVAPDEVQSKPSKDTGSKDTRAPTATRAPARSTSSTMTLRPRSSSRPRSTSQTRKAKPRKPPDPGPPREPTPRSTSQTRKAKPRKPPDPEPREHKLAFSAARSKMHHDKMRYDRLEESREPTPRPSPRKKSQRTLLGTKPTSESQATVQTSNRTTSSTSPANSRPPSPTAEELPAKPKSLPDGSSAPVGIPWESTTKLPLQPTPIVYQPLPIVDDRATEDPEPPDAEMYDATGNEPSHRPTARDRTSDDGEPLKWLGGTICHSDGTPINDPPPILRSTRSKSPRKKKGSQREEEKEEGGPPPRIWIDGALCHPDGTPVEEAPPEPHSNRSQSPSTKRGSQREETKEEGDPPPDQGQHRASTRPPVKPIPTLKPTRSSSRSRKPTEKFRAMSPPAFRLKPRAQPDRSPAKARGRSQPSTRATSTTSRGRSKQPTRAPASNDAASNPNNPNESNPTQRPTFLETTRNDVEALENLEEKEDPSIDVPSHAARPKSSSKRTKSALRRTKTVEALDTYEDEMEVVAAKKKTKKSTSAPSKAKSTSARAKSPNPKLKGRKKATSNRPTTRNPDHPDFSANHPSGGQHPDDDNADPDEDPKQTSKDPRKFQDASMTDLEAKQIRAAKIESLQEQMNTERMILLYNKDRFVQNNARARLKHLESQINELRKPPSTEYKVLTATVQDEPLYASIAVFDDHNVTFSKPSDLCSTKFLDDPSNDEPRQLIHTTHANKSIDMQPASLAAILAHPHNPLLNFGVGTTGQYEMLQHFRVFQTEAGDQSHDRDLVCMTGADVTSLEARIVLPELKLLDSVVGLAPSLEFMCSEGQLTRREIEIAKMPREHLDWVVVMASYLIPTNLAKLLWQVDGPPTQNVIYVICALEYLVNERYEANLQREGREFPRMAHKKAPGNRTLSINLDMMDAMRPYEELFQAAYVVMNMVRPFHPSTTTNENPVVDTYMRETIEMMRSETATYAELWQRPESLHNINLYNLNYLQQPPFNPRIGADEAEALAIPPAMSSVRRALWKKRPSNPTDDVECVGHPPMLVNPPTQYNLDAIAPPNEHRDAIEEAPHPARQPAKEPRLTKIQRWYQAQSVVRHPDPDWFAQKLASGECEFYAAEDLGRKGEDYPSDEAVVLLDGDSSDSDSSLFADSSGPDEPPTKRPRKSSPTTKSNRATKPQLNQTSQAAPATSPSRGGVDRPWSKPRSDTPHHSPRGVHELFGGGGSNRIERPTHQPTSHSRSHFTAGLPGIPTNHCANIFRTSRDRNQANGAAYNPASPRNSLLATKSKQDLPNIMLSLLDKFNQRMKDEIKLREKDLELKEREIERQTERHRETMDKNITQTVMSHHRNVSTADGVNPAPDITELDRACMRSKSLAETGRLVGAFISSLGGTCEPVASFLRACADGDWASNYHKPDKISAFGLPTTLANTYHANLDIDRCEHEYELGRDISEKEKKAFLAAGIIVARSFHTLKEVLKNLCIWGLGMTGESKLYRFLCGTHGHIELNEESLVKVTQGRQRDVVMKIQLKVHNVITRYMTDGLTGVPSESILNMDFVLAQAEDGAIFIRVPVPVEQAAGLGATHQPDQRRVGGQQNSRNNNVRNNNNNNRNGNGGGNRNNNSNNASANASTIYHTNQPQSLKTTDATYAFHVAPRIRDGSVEAPVDPKTKTKRCLNHDIRGHCHNRCSRGENHTAVTDRNLLRQLEDVRRRCRGLAENRRGTNPNANEPDFR